MKNLFFHGNQVMVTVTMIFAVFSIWGCHRESTGKASHKESHPKASFMATTEVFLRQHSGRLAGRHVCLFTNASTTGKYLLEPAIDPAYPSRLHEIFMESGAKGLKVITPEHGLFTQEEDKGNSSRIAFPVVSVFNKPVESWKRELQGCSLLLISLPDSGIRPYTYRTDIVRALRAADAIAQTGKKEKMEIWLLDHPNFAAWLGARGPMTKKSFFSYIGEEEIPFFPGYTYGELAGYYIGLNKLSLDLQIVKVPGYKKTLDAFAAFDYFPPSPSLPDKRSLACYWVTIYFESTYVDEGRFSRDPFCVIGHPSFRFDELPPEKNGVKWEPMVYQPFGGLFRGHSLPAFRMEILDWNKFQPDKEGYEFFTYIRNRFFAGTQTPFYKKYKTTYTLDNLMGSDTFRKYSEKGSSFEIMIQSHKDKTELFRKNLKRYELY